MREGGAGKGLTHPLCTYAVQVLCSRFRLLADLLLSERFLRRWPVAGLATAPPAPTCLVPIKLEHFVVRHVVGRGDSLARIAVKHGTTVPVVKRLNNILSDHTLMTRDAIFVPGGWPLLCFCKRPSSPR